MFFELFFHIGVLYLSARLAKLEAERLAQGEAKRIAEEAERAEQEAAERKQYGLGDNDALL